MKCYEFKLISFKHGIFDNSLDATYILHLENNGRLSNIKKQLQKIQVSEIYDWFKEQIKKYRKTLAAMGGGAFFAVMMGAV